MATTEEYKNGGNATYSFSIEYIKAEDIKVSVNGQDKTYTTTNPPTQTTEYTVNGSNIIFSSPSVSGSATNGVRIYRETALDASDSVTFVAGSSIRAVDLNANQRLIRFSSQEQNQKIITDDIRDSAVTSAKIADGTIVNDDINGNAEIQVSKLKNGAARQVLQTAANGTDVEWTNNVDIPGTLDVTGNADIDSNLNVDGTLTVASAVDFNNDLDVDGNTNLDNTTIDGYINVTGVATVDNVRIDGNEVRAHSGNLELDSLGGTVTVDDNLIVNGTSTLDGTTVDGILDVNGSSTIDNVRIDGNEIDTTSGNLTIDSQGGTTTIDDNLVVSGTLSISNLNADTLDNLDSSQFLRSDTSDTFSATNHSLTFADDTHLNIGSGNDLAIHHDGNHTYITQTNSGQTYAAFINGATFRTGANHKDVVKFIKNNGRVNVELYEGADSSATPTKRFETTSEGVTVTGETKTTSLEINGTDVTATATDLNKLNGYLGSTAELNKIQGYTGTTADLNEVVSGKTVVEEISPTATDAQIPTANAVNQRITTVVSDVGGFVPIANETSFPTDNPDLDNAAGTIVSIKALNSSFTTGSGVTTHTISNGAGSGKNVTITGLTASTTYPAGRGLILETTEYSGGGRGGDADEYEYAFHRLTLDEAGVANAQAVVNDFDERYYGPLGSEPNNRPGGGARVQGDLYFSTVDNQMKVWNNAASQWDDVASSASSNIITLSPAFNGSETEFTCSTVPVDAQSLLLSINGVIQKPNSGTSTPSEGYVKLANGKIKLASAPATGAPYFAIALGNTVSIGTPSPDTVGATELKDGEIANVHISNTAGIAKSKLAALDIVNTDINASAAIARSKIADFVEDNVNDRVLTATGIANTLQAEPRLLFTSSGGDPVLTITGSTTSGHAQLNLKTGGTTDHGSINFGDNDDDDAGEIRYTHSSNLLAFDTAGAPRMVIDSSGKVGIGTTAPSEKLTVADGDLKFFHSNAANAHRTTFIEFGNSSNRITSEMNYGSDSSSNYTAGLKFTTKNFNGSSFVTVDALNIQANGRVGIGTTSPASILELKGSGPRITFTDTAGTNDIAKITGSAGALYLQSRDGDSHGEIIFRTENNATALERMRIKNDGNVSIFNGSLVFASAGNGIDFSATSDATGKQSELLDDYEEGTWTPVLLASSTAFTTAPGYAVRYANYTKIGRQVHCDCYVAWNSSGAGSAGHVRLGGLPFTEGGHGTYPGVYYGFYDIENSLLNENEDLLGYVQNSDTYIVFYKGNNAGGSNILNVATMCNNASGNFQMSFTYMT